MHVIMAGLTLQQRCERTPSFPSVLLILAVSLMAGRLPAQAIRTQTLALSAGWNAVYIEVDPADPAPAAVFAGVPVDAVATHDAVPSTAQFVQNPDADLSLAQGWAVWYAPSRPDAFLSNLYEM